MKRFPKAVRAPVPFRPREDLAKGGRPMKGVVDRKSGSLSRILGVPNSSTEKTEKKEEAIKNSKTETTAAKKDNTGKKDDTDKKEQKQQVERRRRASSTVKKEPPAHPFLSGLSVYVDGVSASAYLSRPPGAGVQQNIPPPTEPTPLAIKETTTHSHKKQHTETEPHITERSLYWADFISLVVIICCWIVLCLCGMHYVSNVDDRLTTTINPPPPSR